MNEHASQPEERFPFPRRLRLTGPAQFRAVYDAGVRVSAGPLLVYAGRDESGHARLGLAVSRRAGGAVARNAVKRRLREAFRLLQHDLPPRDFVISVRRHDPLPMEAYRSLFMEAAERLQRKWNRRSAS